MTNKEIADIVDSSAKKILEENKEIITKDLASLTVLPKTDNAFKESLLSLFTSAVELGAVTSIRTLVDLGYLKISE